LTALALGGLVRAQESKSPAAQQPVSGGGQEMDPRARAVKEAYEDQIRRERLQVTISKRNVKIAEIVDEFRRQIGWNIVVDYKNIPDDFLVAEFRVENEPEQGMLDV
jgi:hypothetical protein